jgi:hypothetical protein
MAWIDCVQGKCLARSLWCDFDRDWSRLMELILTFDVLTSYFIQAKQVNGV